jgi:hypothetical protein
MANNKFNPRFGIIVLMIVAAAATRFMPHPPNFTPIGGMALFGAAHFAKKYWAYLIPFITLWVSDLVMNNVVYAEYQTGFTWFTTFGMVNFLAFGLIVLMGSGVLKKINLKSVIGASLAGSMIFFLVSNFGVWLTSPVAYASGFSGLVATMSAGVPFFWNTLAGDLVYAGILFGGFELAKNMYPSLSLSRA